MLNRVQIIDKKAYKYDTVTSLTVKLSRYFNNLLNAKGKEK